MAVLAAFAAMFAVAVAGLYFLRAGGSVTSLSGSVAAAVVSLAVGGPVSFGAGGQASGLLSMGLAGSLRIIPLGVTLAGSVALGLAFFLPLRGRRRLTPGLLAARITVAACTCLLAALVVAASSRGSMRLPASVAGRLTGGLGGHARSRGLGILGAIFGGQGGGGVGGSLSSVAFRTGVAVTVFGSLVWLLVVLATGLLAGRSAYLPARLATGRLRAAVGPALAATIRVILTVLLVLLVLLVLGTIGSLALAGANGPKTAGAVLLTLPNLVFGVLSVGLGVPWSLSGGSGGSAGAGLGALGRILGGLGGAGGPGRGRSMPIHRSVSLAALPGGGHLLWIPVLLGVAVILLACGVLAAARTPRRTRPDGTPAKASLHRAGLQAVRLGSVWSAGLFTVVAFSGLSATAGLSIMGMPIRSLGAHASASAPLALVLGLLGGAAAGAAGSLLLDAVRSGRDRRFPRPEARGALARSAEDA
jgi:hypothetical protein